MQLLPAQHVRLALETIFNFNVVKFADGQLGAVNGMRPNGSIDTSYIQADEVWTGVTYALGSFFIQQVRLRFGFDCLGVELKFMVLYSLSKCTITR